MAGSSGKQTRSQKLRQNMINMMYLVFIAMLALQISKEVLATLGIVSEDMEKSTAQLSKVIIRVMLIFLVIVIKIIIKFPLKNSQN